MDSLSDIRLAHNWLAEVPPTFCSGKLQRTLGYLDLSDNQLIQLPRDFFRLQSLSTLKIDRNQLKRIPMGISQLRLLVHLSLSENQLRMLPDDFSKLQLQNLDISSNPFQVAGQSSVNVRLHVPSLLESAGRTINKFGYAFKIVYFSCLNSNFYIQECLRLYGIKWGEICVMVGTAW